jgi:uncharacterized membrane protein
MNREVSMIIVAAVAIVLIFVALQPILPSYSDRYSELGVLGPNGAVGGYPTRVTQGTVVHLYVLVGNNEGLVTYYQVVLKLGNSTTNIGDRTGADAPEIMTYPLVLANNKTSTFPISVDLVAPGTDMKLIIELWSYNISSSQFIYTGLSNSLSINVTVGA